MISLWLILFVLTAFLLSEVVRDFCRKEKAQTKVGVVQDDLQVKLDDGHYIDLDPAMQRDPAFDVKPGDKVKVIVVKT